MQRSNRNVCALIAEKTTPNERGDNLHYENNMELLGELKETLAAIPEKYHEDVARALTHDAGVIARTISMVEGQAT